MKTDEEIHAVLDDCATAIKGVLNGEAEDWTLYCAKYRNRPDRLAVATSLALLALNSKRQEQSVAISALEARIDGLEARPVGVTDKGIWMSGVEYPAGSGVSRSGSYWIAQPATTAMPGSAGPESTGWRLAAKAGRDGKDLR